MATAPSIGSYGERLDLNIKQGSTFGASVVASDANGPLDLTGCTVRGQIRRKALDASIIETFTCAITDAPEGAFTFGLTDEETAAMTAGETVTASTSKYVYDIELEDTLGRVTPLLYGNVTLFREVTR